MKYCPKCDTRFDEEILRFCTKDGTPLIEEGGPKFTEIPSESIEGPGDDDPGEITVIRRNTPAQGAPPAQTAPPVPAAPPALDEETSFQRPEPGERIVIPTSPEPIVAQQVRPRTSQAYYPPPPESNTGRTVALTIMGTLVVLGLGAILFWFLQKEAPANKNVNANFGNVNTNINTSMPIDSNFNFNTGGTTVSTPTNLNLNANLKTPTPTPKPSPSTSASPSPSGTPTSSPIPTPRTTPTDRGSPSPTPRNGPRPPTPTPNGTPTTGN